MSAGFAADGYPSDALRENWQSVNELAFVLADKIEGHCLETGEQFDKMVLIPRGSYPPANIISRRLGFNANHLLHMCMTSYADGEIERSGKFIYGQMPKPEEVDGFDLLVIEEVCDTGETLQHASDLLELAGAGLVRTAALHYKPTRSTTGFKPDWYANETDAWIVYPWEKDERIGKKSTVRRPNADDLAPTNGHAAAL
jgi:hypoxanthine phosphoribosyltransferase